MSCNIVPTDAPPNFLKDLDVSSNVKTMEEGVGVFSLVRNILGGKRGILEL
jgi:hypothetical protein